MSVGWLLQRLLDSKWSTKYKYNIPSPPLEQHFTKHKFFVTELRRHLSSDLFGQHIATDVILKQLNAHLSNKSPLKPLVMSFHGWTGNGKNHVAYLIAKSLFLKGAESKHYHHFMATTHFPHASHTTQYQDQIRSWISGNVSNCKNSLFVFDEVDKMPCGVLDGIRSFLDYNEHVDRVDFRYSKWFQVTW